MRRCKLVRHLQAYLDCELPLPQREQLRRHLDECPECTQELESLQRIGRLLAELSPLQPPRHLMPATLQRMRAVPSRTVRFHGLPAAAATSVAAACLLVVLQVFMLHSGGDLSTRPELSLESTAPAETLVASQPVAPAVVFASRTEAAPRPQAMSARAKAVAERPKMATDAAPAAHQEHAAIPAEEFATAERQAAAAFNALRREVGEDDPDLMVAALQNVALKYPGTAQAAEALLQAGDLQRRRGQTAEADAIYRSLLTSSSDNSLPRALAHKALGDLRAETVGADDELARYHYQQATQALRHEVATGEGSQRALLVMADIASETGDRAEAVADYAKAANQGVADPAVDSLAEVL